MIQIQWRKCQGKNELVITQLGKYIKWFIIHKKDNDSSSIWCHYIALENRKSAQGKKFNTIIFILSILLSNICIYKTELYINLKIFNNIFSVIQKRRLNLRNFIYGKHSTSPKRVLFNSFSHDVEYIQH